MDEKSYEDEDGDNGRYLVKLWNISHLLDERGKMMKGENGMDITVNRANNPLEKFNGRMNQEKLSEPTMQMFVTKNKGIANWYVDEMCRIKNSKKVVTTSRPPARVLKVPDDFYDFFLRSKRRQEVDSS